MRISHFGPPLAWLLSRDVPAARLAAIFKTTPENIRVIAYRARHSASQDLGEEPPLGGNQNGVYAECSGIRPGPDEVVRTPSRTRALESLKAEIDHTVAAYAARYAFNEGAQALRGILPNIGFPGDTRRIALSAYLRRQIAWFLVHAGRCQSAGVEAADARNLCRRAWGQQSDPEYAREFIQSALIASNGLLLSRQPERSWKLLDIAEDAATAISAPIGSEPHRQRGVALLLLQRHEQAAEQFRKAAEAMERLGEASSPAQALMTGARHSSLAELNWDKAQEVEAAARQSFGAGSLEAAMALHWAAACGLSTDSAEANQTALFRLQGATEPPAHFGHQLTIRTLLAITPGLGFDVRLRRLWVKRALYENAFRAR